MTERHSEPLARTGDGRGQLVLDQICKEFVNPRTKQCVVALEDVRLTVEPGEFVAIVGPSGCGKTTLLKVIAGMIAPTSGQLSVQSTASRPSSDDRESGSSTIGMVFQHASLYPWRTLVDNVGFGLELKAQKRSRLDRLRRRTRPIARDALRLVGLEGFERFYPHEVSGGMQQRANLARALVVRPHLLLMDEPFSALDAQTREELQIELQRIAVAADTTAVFVTHDIREAAYLADRVVVMTRRPGRVKTIVEIPTPRPRPFEYHVSDEYVNVTRTLWSLVHSDEADDSRVLVAAQEAERLQSSDATAADEPNV